MNILYKLFNGKMTKGEIIGYVINKECSKRSLQNLCDRWNIDMYDYFRFLEAGKACIDNKKEGN